MSTTIEAPPTTANQRAVSASSALREFFGLDDSKLLSTALAEVALREAKKNSAFAEQVRQAYQDLTALTKSSKGKRSKPTGRSTVTPIAKVEGYNLDPFAPLDPYFIYKAYGHEQFRAALEDRTLAGLKEAARKLMETHPGTKPASFAKKDAVIDYIVEIVTKGK